jgi:hypothetical protein
VPTPALVGLVRGSVERPRTLRRYTSAMAGGSRPPRSWLPRALGAAGVAGMAALVVAWSDGEATPPSSSTSTPEAPVLAVPAAERIAEPIAAPQPPLAPEPPSADRPAASVPQARRSDLPPGWSQADAELNLACIRALTRLRPLSGAPDEEQLRAIQRHRSWEELEKRWLRYKVDSDGRAVERKPPPEEPQPYCPEKMLREYCEQGRAWDLEWRKRHPQ